VALVTASGRTSNVVVSSFWPDSLVAVRDASPEMATGLLVTRWFEPTEAVGAAVARGCTALHPSIDLASAALVDQAHDAGLSVAVWTLNDPDRIRAMAELGVDTVITDDVATALTVV
jgi:glycerophosphoryl diester phosphodiesterase